MSNVAFSDSLPGEGYVSLASAAEYFEVSEKTLRRMIMRSEIPAYRLGGNVRGPIRVKISEIEAAMFPMCSAASA